MCVCACMSVCVRACVCVFMCIQSINYSSLAKILQILYLTIKYVLIVYALFKVCIRILQFWLYKLVTRQMVISYMHEQLLMMLESKMPCNQKLY